MRCDAISSEWVCARAAVDGMQSDGSVRCSLQVGSTSEQRVGAELLEVGAREPQARRGVRAGGGQARAAGPRGEPALGERRGRSDSEDTQSRAVYRYESA